MPRKKKAPRRSTSRRTRPQGKRRESAKSGNVSLGRRLDELTEQLDIMLPELTARIAALEHLLVEKKLCTREDLIRSREFVRIQED